MKKEDLYKEVRVMHHHNGKSIVLVPDLTPQERERRMRQVHDAAAALLFAKGVTDSMRTRFHEQAEREEQHHVPTDCYILDEPRSAEWIEAHYKNGKFVPDEDASVT